MAESQRGSVDYFLNDQTVAAAVSEHNCHAAIVKSSYHISYSLFGYLRAKHTRVWLAHTVHGHMLAV